MKIEDSKESDVEMGDTKSEENEDPLENYTQFGSIPRDFSITIVFTLPMSFGAKPNQGNFMEGDVLEDENILATPEFVKPNKTDRLKVTVLRPKTEGVGEQPVKAVFEKPNGGMSQHLRPLYINATIDGVPHSRVLIDNEAVVNILLSIMLIRM